MSECNDSPPAPPRRILVTGHSTGLGAALARLHLARGDGVDGIARRALPAQDGLRQVSCDIGDAGALEAALGELGITPGGYERVYLNAGVLGPIESIRAVPLATVQAVMDINTWANLRILRWLAAAASPPRVVLALSSGAAITGHQGWGPYALSKAALNMLVQLFAAEMPASHLLALAPGLVDTAMQAGLRRVDAARFPSVARLQAAHGTAAMPDADTVARRIDAALPVLLERPSGSYVDLRTL